MRWFERSELLVVLDDIDVNVGNKDGYTPLHFAGRFQDQDPEIAEYMVARRNFKPAPIQSKRGLYIFTSQQFE